MAKPSEPADPAPLRIGAILKALRTERGYTLQEVADGAGLSVSFLSLLENDKSDVSLARLQRIAHFYGVSVSDIFATERRAVRRVIPLAEAPRLFSPNEGVIVRGLVEDPERGIDPWYSTMEPGSGYQEPIIHPGEEFRHVIDGHIRVWLGDEVYDLHPGDTIYHPSHIPHVYANVGDTRSIVIGCSTRIPTSQRIRRRSRGTPLGS